VTIRAPNEPKPVKYISAITFSDEVMLAEAINGLQQELGDCDCETSVFAFEHSRYYEKEMGPQLSKKFISFQTLDKVDLLVNRKLFAIKLEKKFAVDGKRRVNIDPAYLELAKLVVATTKNYDHRIYLGDGIYGDLQLRYRGGKFVANDWTYPDYRSAIFTHFIEEVRNIYFNQLQQLE